MRELRGGDCDGWQIHTAPPVHQTVITSPKGSRYYLRLDGHFYIDGCKWDNIPPFAKGD